MFALAGEEGGDDAKSACPFDVLGYTRDTMGGTVGRDGVTLSQSSKPSLVRIEVCNSTS